MKVIFSDLDGTYYLMRHIANKPIINTFELAQFIYGPSYISFELDSCWTNKRALPYYRISNPAFADIAKRAIDEVLVDHKCGP
ncbi:MAG: hypothetical protein A3F17_08500 [Gammaproteobacteria bacterium RIFCSPHIGHO2_12_FULL_41_15]|nr:MAG: hypothetical protein A3F17_08500 [Gammaproteobacteria bacterium RIFCSPHIGHO2_12_FULL_41_15]